MNEATVEKDLLSQEINLMTQMKNVEMSEIDREKKVLLSDMLVDEHSRFSQSKLVFEKSKATPIQIHPKLSDYIYIFLVLFSCCPNFSFVDSVPFFIGLVYLITMLLNIGIKIDQMKVMTFFYAILSALVKGGVIIFYKIKKIGNTSDIDNFGVNLHEKSLALSFSQQIFLFVISLLFRMKWVLGKPFSFFSNNTRNLIVLILILGIYITNFGIAQKIPSYYGGCLLIFSHLSLLGVQLIRTEEYKKLGSVLYLLIFSLLSLYGAAINVINIKIVRDIVFQKDKAVVGSGSSEPGKEAFLKFVYIFNFNDKTLAKSDLDYFLSIMQYSLLCLSISMTALMLKVINLDYYYKKEEKLSEEQGSLNSLKNYFLSSIKSAKFYLLFLRLVVIFWVNSMNEIKLVKKDTNGNEEKEGIDVTPFQLVQKVFSMVFPAWVFLSFLSNNSRFLKVLLHFLFLLIISYFYFLYNLYSYFYYKPEKKDDEERVNIEDFFNPEFLIGFNLSLFFISLSFLFIQKEKAEGRLETRALSFAEDIESESNSLMAKFMKNMTKSNETSKNPLIDDENLVDKTEHLLQSKTTDFSVGKSLKDNGENDEESYKNMKSNLFNLFLKVIYSNFDIILLIFSYLSALHKIYDGTQDKKHGEIVYWIQIFNYPTIVVILLFQTFFPKYKKLYLSAYGIMYCVDTYKDLVTGTKNFGGLELKLVITMHLIYFKIEIEKSGTYRDFVVQNKVSLYNYLLKLTKSRGKAQARTEIFFKVLAQVKLLVLLSLYMYLTAKFEITCIMALHMFFVVYEFSSLFIHIQDNSLETFKTSNVMINVVQIFFSFVFFILVYVYQFIQPKVINNKDTSILSSNPKVKKFLKNLVYYGFSKYKTDNLEYQFFYRFLPYYGPIILGIFLYSEKKNYSTTNYNLAFAKTVKKETELSERKESEKEKKKEDQPKELDQQQIILEYYSRKITLLLHETIFVFYFIGSYLSELYWLGFFVFICYYFLKIYMAVSVLIYLSVFFIIFILTFKRRYNQLKPKPIDNGNQEVDRITGERKPKYLPHFFLILKYGISEPTLTFKLKNYYSKLGFRAMYFVAIIIFYITFIYAIFDRFQNGCKSPPGDSIFCPEGLDIFPLVGMKIQDNIQALFYILGIYIDLENESVLGWENLCMVLITWFSVYTDKLQSFFVLKMKSKIIEIKSMDPGTLDEFFVKSLENSKKAKEEVLEKSMSGGINEVGEEEENNVNMRNSFIIIDNDNNTGDTYHDEKMDNIFDILDKTKGATKGVKVIKEFFRKVFTPRDYVEPKKKTKVFLALKIVLEQLIMFFLVIACIIKLNIWSLCYMIAAFLFYCSNQKIKKMYYLMIYLTVATIIQIMLFISNISLDTDPELDKVPILILQKNFFIPWSHLIMDDNLGFFFGMGVNKKQVKTISIEFLIIFFLQIYLDCYSLKTPEKYELLTIKNEFKINFDELVKKKDMRTAFEKLSIEQYYHNKETFLSNCDAEIDKFEVFKMKFRRSLEDFQDNPNYEELKEKYEREERIDDESIAKTLIKGFLLTSQVCILTAILIISIFHTSLISVFYVGFSVFYLKKSYFLVKGAPFGFIKTARVLIKPLILLDIIVQMTFQTPFMEFPEFSKILKTIGIFGIIDYNDPREARTYEIDGTVMTFAIMKAVSLFLLNIQTEVYTSPIFREYYLVYLFTRKKKVKTLSILHTYLFNNRRMKDMEKSIDKRKQMTTILGYLENWLGSAEQEMNFTSILKKGIVNSETSSMVGDPSDLGDEDYNLVFDEKEIQKLIKDAKNKILDYPLYKIYFFLNRRAFSYRKTKNNINKLRIIKGKSRLLSDIEINVMSIFSKVEPKRLKDFLESGDTQKDLTSIINKLKITEFEEIAYLHRIFHLSFIIQSIVRELVDIIASNFRYVCYFMMLLCHMVNASVLSFFYPVIVFCYGMIIYPSPNYLFWEICLIYSLVMANLKFLVNNQFLRDFSITSKISENITSPLHFVGITFIKEGDVYEFFRYFIFDCIAAGFILIQLNLLSYFGRMKKYPQEIESINAAINRKFSSKYKEDEELLHNFSESCLKKGYHQQKKKVKIENFFTKIRNEKPGGDYFLFYIIAQFLSIFYIMLFFSFFIELNDKDLPKIAYTRLSKGMLILVFIKCLLCMLDRIIYLNQTRTNFELDYIFYSKGKQISDEEKKAVLEEVKEKLAKEEELVSDTEKKKEEKPFFIPFDSLEELNREYDITYIQKETFNYPLVFKLALHLFIFLFSHLVAFAYFPLLGNKAINDSYFCSNKQMSQTSCNYFRYNPYLVVSYLFDMVYLFFSAIQLNAGFMDIKKKSVLKEGNSIVIAKINEVVNAIPLLTELTTALDWASIKTSLDIFQTIKFQKTYESFYISNARASHMKKMKVGKRISILNRVIYGWGIFVLALAIIFVPLVFYSEMNPLLETNDITGGKIRVYLSFLYDNGYKNYTLFEDDSPVAIKSFGQYSKLWKKYGYEDLSDTNSFEKERVQIMLMGGTSERTWSPSKPVLDEIIKVLDKYESISELRLITLSMNYQFFRPFPEISSTSNDTIKHIDRDLFRRGTEEKQENFDAIRGLFESIENCMKKGDTSSYSITMKNFIAPAVRLSMNARPKRIKASSYFITTFLEYVCEKEGNYFKFHPKVKEEKAETDPLAIDKEDVLDIEDAGVFFHAFSEKVSTYNISLTQVMLYLTYLLTIAGILRGFLSFPAEKSFLEEAPYCRKMLKLCEGIEISKDSEDLEMEERLYSILVEFLRSPENLKNITHSTIELFNKRKQKFG